MKTDTPTAAPTSLRAVLTAYGFAILGNALLLALLIFITKQAFAEPVPTRVVETVRKEMGVASQVTDVVHGDLNQDGIDDFAALVSTRENIAGEKQVKMVVFFGTRSGTYQLFAASSDVFYHEHEEIDLQFKDASVYFHRRGPDGCCANWHERFQFKMHHNELVLVGKDEATYGPIDNMAESGSSVNYLTNEVVFWKKMGSKLTEHKRKFASFDSIKLQSFDYRTYLHQVSEEEES